MDGPPTEIKSGNWCPYCAGRRQTIDEMKSLAKSKGGKCLSDEFHGVEKKLKWMCEKGHTWEAIPNNVKRGSWCPTCAGRIPLSIEEMKIFAQQRGGKCLSKEYKNNRTKLQWQCAKGHVWWAAPYSIKSGRWCRKCAYENLSERFRGSLKEMQDLAQERGGKCLSDKYINARKKLKWMCNQGHIWESTPDGMKHGKWCPICAKENK